MKKKVLKKGDLLIAIEASMNYEIGYIVKYIGSPPSPYEDSHNDPRIVIESHTPSIFKTNRTELSAAFLKNFKAHNVKKYWEEA